MRRAAAVLSASIFLGVASLAFARDLTPQEQRVLHLRALELKSEELLAKERRNCAMHLMPKIKQEVEADKEARAFLPEVHAYCLKAIEASAKRGLLMDLYINLALQEQGYSEFHFAEQAQLLKNDEAGHTAGRILRAAIAGETSYTSIKGQNRALNCPLALDVSFTWGFRNGDKAQPFQFTVAEIEAIATACYDPTVMQITVKSQAAVPQKAGMLAGAWLGRQQATGK